MKKLLFILLLFNFNIVNAQLKTMSSKEYKEYTAKETKVSTFREIERLEIFVDIEKYRGRYKNVNNEQVFVYFNSNSWKTKVKFSYEDGYLIWAGYGYNKQLRDEYEIFYFKDKGSFIEVKTKNYKFIYLIPKTILPFKIKEDRVKLKPNQNPLTDTLSLSSK